MSAPDAEDRARERIQRRRDEAAAIDRLRDHGDRLLAGSYTTALGERHVDIVRAPGRTTWTAIDHDPDEVYVIAHRCDRLEDAAELADTYLEGAALAGGPLPTWPEIDTVRTGRAQETLAARTAAEDRARATAEQALAG